MCEIPCGELRSNSIQAVRSAGSVHEVTAPRRLADYSDEFVDCCLATGMAIRCCVDPTSGHPKDRRVVGGREHECRTSSEPGGYIDVFQLHPAECPSGGRDSVNGISDASVDLSRRRG